MLELALLAVVPPEEAPPAALLPAPLPPTRELTLAVLLPAAPVLPPLRVVPPEELPGTVLAPPFPPALLLDAELLPP